jgi:hypothetical protein
MESGGNMEIYAMKIQKNNARSSDLWLWAAVVVGKGEQLYTHGSWNKVFMFKLLPRKADAPNGKPRGLVSIRKKLQERVSLN